MPCVPATHEKIIYILLGLPLFDIKNACTHLLRAQYDTMQCTMPSVNNLELIVVNNNNGDK